MIIYGTKGVSKTLSRGSFSCPFCRAPRPYRLKSIRKYFTLYFIPLFPVGEAEKFVECDTCAQAYDPVVLAEDVADAMAPAPLQAQASPARTFNKCTSCGGSISPSDDECPYCHSPTPKAHAVRQADAAAALHQENLEESRRDAEEEDVKKAGLHSLIWSLLGVFVCCFPISIVGLIKALSARKQAQAQGMAVPGTAWAGLVLSAVGLLMTVVFGIWFKIDSANLERRKEEAARIAAAGVGDAELSQQTACALVEREVLENGYRDLGAISIDAVECLGTLEQNGELWSLGEIRLHGNGRTRDTVRGCFAHGSQWYVKEVVDSAERCGGPKAEPPENNLQQQAPEPPSEEARQAPPKKKRQRRKRRPKRRR